MLFPVMPIAALVSAGCAPSDSHAVSERGTTGSYYVQSTTKVYLGPTTSSQVTNTLYTGERLDVEEIDGSWARISRYYDGSAEGLSGQVARWVKLGNPDQKKPSLPKDRLSGIDPRIKGLPSPGQGVSKKDVEILYAAALYYLEVGRASRIAFGDKSVNKRDTYYGESGRFACAARCERGVHRADF